MQGRERYSASLNSHQKNNLETDVNKCFFKILPVTAMMLLAVNQVWADDTAGQYFGYFRAGVGANSEHVGGQACFGLPGVPKYRFGNECDTYGEFGYAKELARSANGTSFVATVMSNYYAADSVGNGKNWGLTQMMVEAKNLDFMHGGTVWVGKRYYNRPDVHVVDTQMVGMDGVGAGIDGIPVGPGKFSYAFMRDDNLDPGSTTVVTGSSSATRHQFLYHDVPVNVNGFVNFDATIITANSMLPNATGGYSLSIAHKQAQIFGGDNTLWLQYGAGAGAQKPGQVGRILAGSATTQARIADQLIWRLNSNFTGSLNFIYQRNQQPGGSTTWTSIGTRPTYSLADNVKLVLDIGHDRLTQQVGRAMELTKISFGPVLSAGRGFWDRPELRAIVTYAKWNQAAQAASAPGSTLSSTGVFGTATRGISFDTQVEVWF
jgi:maltoporin